MHSKKWTSFFKFKGSFFEMIGVLQPFGIYLNSKLPNRRSCTLSPQTIYSHEQWIELPYFFPTIPRRNIASFERINAFDKVNNFFQIQGLFLYNDRCSSNCWDILFENKSDSTKEAALFHLKESIHINSEFSTWHCFSKRKHIFPAETLHRTCTFLTRRVYLNERWSI